MATHDESVTPAEPAPPPHKGHSRWLWVSAILAVVAIGLLVWGLTKSSDLSSAQDDLATQQQAGAAAATQAKDAVGDLSQDLNETNKDLDQAKQDVETANTQAQDAQQQADDAKAQAEQAQNETEKAQAQAEEAQAEAKAAESRLQVAKGCAQSYLAAIGDLFEGENPQAQAPAVRQQLEGITADCKAAFAGS